MSEYIERGAIKYEQWFVGPLNAPLMVVRKKTIDSIPAVDVEQVIRCKNCYQSCWVKGMFGETLFCTYWNKDTDEDGYCHEGG